MLVRHCQLRFHAAASGAAVLVINGTVPTAPAARLVVAYKAAKSTQQHWQSTHGLCDLISADG